MRRQGRRYISAKAEKRFHQSLSLMMDGMIGRAGACAFMLPVDGITVGCICLEAGWSSASGVYLTFIA